MAAWRSSFNFSFTFYDNVCHPLHARRFVGQPVVKYIPDGFIIRVELDEVEAASQRQVDQRYRAVGGVSLSR